MRQDYLVYIPKVDLEYKFIIRNKKWFQDTNWISCYLVLIF